MKTDTKFASAIHICLYLQYRGVQLLSSKEIAESVAINPVVIRRLLASLGKADLVGSISGSKGGFYLKKNIDNINLWNVYQAVNDYDPFYKPKVNAGCPVSCNLNQLIKLPFQSAELAMKPGLEQISLAHLYADLEGLLKSTDNYC